ncbi:GPP34 family phosphoprotein [Saccharopolyspora spinosa]|uniref:Golgi phosphoprotein 3 GPP34 n=1 Tax=Saccharopolyspora spinosa TaxID=60894 RepID=A0A2N3Y3P0_SACSN|nr:GPP34 family phosphoprotein [Saccharopolyspora spinosa]PKW17548.1 Golgi phosphoprotein 3 GPP34 [Saccharopolyspora spinosa]
MTVSGQEPTRIPLRVADRFFLAAHTGEQRLSARVDGALVALGCAGALLAELILEEEIAVTPSVRPSGKGRCPDFLSWTILREVRQESGHDMRTWLEYLGQTATEKVRARLTIIDVLREVPVSGGWRGGTAAAWQFAEDGASKPEADLEVLFTSVETAGGSGMITIPSRIADISLALLLRETGVLRQIRLPKHIARQGEYRMESWEPRIPGALRSLINEVSAARGQVAITPRH